MNDSGHVKTNSDALPRTEQLLPVAIMAHNEEKVVKRAVASVLDQRVPFGYAVRATVVTNGCTDGTESIVSEMARIHPGKVELVSLREKGKTRAINGTIRHLDNLVNCGVRIPYVIFLDADCEFAEHYALERFLQCFEENPLLCAIGAHCLPDVLYDDGRRDVVAKTYRAIYRFRDSLEVNSISGMCYGIRFDVAKRMEFPEFQFAEDMFAASRLDGYFLQDKRVEVTFKTPCSVMDEIGRRTRQSVSTQRYHDYYSLLKRKGPVKLIPGTLGERYRWKGAGVNASLRAWLRMKGFRNKAYVLNYVIIRVIAKTGSYFKIRRINRKAFDYWRVSR
jgi:glycosyltransferase involved in cell wall biosynthesis